MERSGFFIRAIAAFTDVFIYGILSVLVYIAAFQYELFNQNDLWNIKHRQLAPSLLQKLFLIQNSIYFIYYAGEVFFRTTPGKACFGIAIAHANGKSAHVFQLIVRFVFKHLAVFLYSAGMLLSIVELKIAGVICTGVTVVGCFLALGVTRKALHDYLSNTAIYPADSIRKDTERSKNAQSQDSKVFRRRNDVDKW